MRAPEAVLARHLDEPVRISRGADRAAALTPLLDVHERVDSLVFPHVALSLTHAGGLAFAARVDHCAGVGVDYEPWREVDMRVARFFLRPREVTAVAGPRDLLRRWTIKEALFKATPHNGDRVLTDYEINDPGAPCGVVAAAGERLRYACIDLGSGHLAVAVCEGRRDGGL
ncbi:MAG TPA: 4'-phosphopantetheinyl transferase superfamily protein [Mycobacteriales bacterium]|nr:4'-phosphopantetheinyl transferase superfamily protein [Mycobacteriales bacterium]